MLPALFRARWFPLVGGLAVLCVLAFADPAWAQDERAQPDESIFLYILKSAGWVFGSAFVLMSLVLVGLIVLLLLDLRMSVAIPPGFVDEFVDTVNKRRFKEAFDMARNDPSFLGRVLTAGMSRLQYGIDDARDAVLALGSGYVGHGSLLWPGI